MLELILILFMFVGFFMMGSLLKRKGLGYVNENGEAVFHWWIGVLIIVGIGLMTFIVISIMT